MTHNALWLLHDDSTIRGKNRETNEDLEVCEDRTLEAALNKPQWHPGVEGDRQ